MSIIPFTDLWYLGILQYYSTNQFSEIDRFNTAEIYQPPTTEGMATWRRGEPSSLHTGQSYLLTASSVIQQGRTERSRLNGWLRTGPIYRIITTITLHVTHIYRCI